jgi:hypothetical protein
MKESSTLERNYRTDEHTADTKNIAYEGILHAWNLYVWVSGIRRKLTEKYKLVEGKPCRERGEV